MSKRREIFVNLLSEPGASRLVLGERVGRNLCRLHGAVPNNERWEFQPGQIVRCEEKTFTGGCVLVMAVAAVDPIAHDRRR